MTKQLFVHVGDCKTGSTTIQTMLAEQAYAIDATRVCYPGPKLQASLARTLTSRRDVFEKRWSNLAQKLAGEDWDVAVVSSELFEFVPPKALAQALESFLPEYAAAARIVAYIRPHAGRLVSQFAENLNLGHDTGDFQACYDRLVQQKRLEYAPRLERWRAVFGDRLTVRPFSRDQLAGGDVRRDFLTLMARGAAVSLDSAIDTNDSLPLSDLALMRLLQRDFIAAQGAGQPGQVAFGKNFARLLRARPTTRAPEKLRLPRGIHDDMIDRFGADAAEMDRVWCDAPCFVPALAAAGENTCDPAQSLEAGDHFDPETIRLMRVWADLTIRQMGDAPQNFARRMRNNN